MDILELNVGCSVGSKHGRHDLNSIFECKPKQPIVILTEFYRLHDYREFNERFNTWGYKTFITSYEEGVNDVFIAVSKEYRPLLKTMTLKGPTQPRALAVTVELEGKCIDVVGVRFYGNYSDMALQFKNFLKFIKKFECIVVGGDFNNGKIRGSERFLYSEQEIDIIYETYLQYEYNYHRIKLGFNNMGLTLKTPVNGVSYPYKPPYVGGSKIDHFAVKGVDMVNVEYIDTNVSDHNILVGTIILK